MVPQLGAEDTAMPSSGRLYDRDPLFTPRFTEILRVAGVKTVKLPPKSPNLNAFVERFVLTAGPSVCGG